MKQKISTAVMFMLMFILSINVSYAKEDNLLESMGFEYKEIDGVQVPVGKPITIDQATEYVERKGYQLIYLFQKIAKPITLFVMVVCGLMAVISGVIGDKKKNSGHWIWAAVVSAICYTGIIFSPVILESIVNFVKS